MSRACPSWRKACRGRGPRGERRGRGAPVPAAWRARRGERRQAAREPQRCGARPGGRRGDARRRRPRGGAHGRGGRRRRVAGRSAAARGRRGGREGRRRLGRGRAGGAVDGAPGAGRRHWRDERQEHDDVARRRLPRGRTGCARSWAATSASRSPTTPTKRSTRWCSKSRASRWSASTRSDPHVSALLNVTDDHLDRYASFDDYAHAKGNAFQRQTPEDWAVRPVRRRRLRTRGRRGAGARRDVSARAASST